jgi:hypothetical protein
VTSSVTVIISGGFSLAYHKVLPEFEHSTGIAVTTLSGASQGTGPKTIKYQLEAGADVDVVIMSKEGLGELIAIGRIAAGSDAELATVPLGAAVRQGDPKPDLGSVEAFKQAVLNARLVALPASTSGIFVKDEVFPRLGIAGKASSRMMARGTESTALLAAGEADLAIGPARGRAGGRASRRCADDPDVHGGDRQHVAQAGAGEAADRVSRLRPSRGGDQSIRHGAGRQTLAHDPEKCEAVFRKDHAPTIGQPRLVNLRRLGSHLGTGFKRMDISLVTAILAAQSGAVQQQIATAVTRQNLDSEKSSVLTLLDSAQQSLSLANVGAGVGGNLNIAA